MTEKYDIPGRVFDFNKDLAYGQEGEALVASFLDSLSGGDFEVKSDRYRNGRMVIETNQNPRGTRDHSGNPIWVPSGINVTTARWWVYVFSPEGAFVVIETNRLRRFLKANKHIYNEGTKKNLGGEDNPAKGFLIMANEVKDLLTNPRYDKES